MGAKVSVRNQTPYTWYYTNSPSKGYQCLTRGSCKEYEEKKAIKCYIYLKYGNRSRYTFCYEFNTLKKNNKQTTFTLRESFDRSRIELHCNTETNVQTCPNYGKLEDDLRQLEQQQRLEEQRRREQEELRRQEQLAREQQIEEQVEQENEARRQKLSDAKERLRQKQTFKGQEQHHQRTQVLHQLVEDDAAAIERDEPGDVEEKFKTLLSEYSIKENEATQHDNIGDKIKTLQNELIIQYCTENNLSIWFQSTVDQAVGYEDLSLTDKFSLLKAVVQITVEGNLQSVGGGTTEAGYDMKNNFFLSLLEKLYVTTPTLAKHLLLNMIESTSELSASCNVILSQMVFNNIWTPVEIMLFVQSASGVDENNVAAILHTVQTYRLDCLSALGALDKVDPVTHLKEHEVNELKDADTLLNEMRESNYPDKMLLVLEDVLKYMESELPKYALFDLSEEEIEEGKQKIKSLDFDNPDMDILKEALIGLSLAVQDCTTFTASNGEKIQGFFPRLNQFASLLMLLLTNYGTQGEEEHKGCLLEIGTGEGKSCILAMFATIQGIRGAKVDIVTSNPVLAVRDQEEWEKLYSKFGLTSSVIPPQGGVQNYEELVKDAYNKQIVFGTVGAFAADVLKQEFERQTTRGNRGFDLVIVDEVDYMTLDNGVQVTFLSHEASGMRHIEQVLANIWAMTSACRPIKMLETEEIHWTAKIQHFHKAAFSAVAGLGSNFSAYDILLPGLKLGFFSQADVDLLTQAEEQSQDEGQGQEIQDSQWKAIETLMEKIGIEQQYDLLRILEIATGIQIECYSETNNKAILYNEEKTEENKVKMLLLENGRACQILSEKEVIDATVFQIKSKISYSDQWNADSLEQTKEFMVVPSYLKAYIETILPVFVENALKAIGMTPGREYMIDKGPAAEQHNLSDTDHQYHVIIPVDFKASGVLEKNKRWGDGLQQFLEMKHQLAVSQMSNVTNYMSNFHCFKRYINGTGIFGVSGTLGGQAEQEFLARHYKTKSYPIPGHRHKIVIELPVIQVSGYNPWIQKICETARRVTEQGQVVLVICEDVKTANEVQREMQTQGIDPTKITMYTISGRHNIEKRKFDGGNIIIATNLGGRGTDVKVEKEVNRCGGLFVLLTHFPSNRRIEKQVFGRTGRKGNPGMVQMVLRQDHLAEAYQGQSTEVMRDLREGYEISRVADMERDELLAIEIKEQLFSTFCQFLDGFDRNYTVQEKTDFYRMLLQAPEHLPNKFDYQPALNALKESWALWLTLHEEHINRHDDIETLKSDLILELEKTSSMLLQGESNNFYDHIKQAISRTDLHCRNRSKSDYGALSCWETISRDNEMYSAVALYNQAFITINLQQQDYKSKAKELLEKALALVDVYLSETAITMVSCNLSVTTDFEPHHTDSTNFQTQMEARMSIFKSWKGYIESALNKLEELLNIKNDAVAEESSVYTLSDQTDYITTNELEALYDYGLGIVFEVKKKPRFCIDALVCFVLGVIQVVGGVLVCALSFGSASQIGLGLIAEGVSDMISGIKGMIEGSFSWAEWAVTKAISLGVSLVTGGFGAIKTACTTAKSLITGAKTFSSVVDDVINSGKHIFMSVKGTAQNAVSGIFIGTVKKLASSTVLKQNLKHASKYAIQEIGSQAVKTALSYVVDEGIQAFFHSLLEDAFKSTVSSAIETNSAMDQDLTKLVCSGVPKAALQKEASEFKIDTQIEEHIKQLVESGLNIEELISNYTMGHKVMDKLSEVAETSLGIIKNKSVIKGIKIAVELAEYTTTFVEILQTVPTSAIINEEFVPTFSEKVKDVEPYDHDGRHNLPDVKRLKDDLLSNIAEKVSDAFIEACAQRIASLSTRELKKKLNSTAGKTVSNVLGRYKSQRFFDDQRHKQDMRAAASTKSKPLSESERMELQDYVGNLSNEQRPATNLDLHVLTKSDLLGGKGIRLTVVDKQGKKLSEEYYPGTDSSGEEITLRLTKEPLKSKPEEGISALTKERSLGEQHPYSGHFAVVRSDGSSTPVESKNQNSLYKALVQATGNSQGDDINEKAVKLRNDVQKHVQSNVDQYSNLLKLQKGYEEAYKNNGKYTIGEGAKGSTDDSYKRREQAYFQSLSPMAAYSIAKTYRLGFVDKYNCLKNQRRKRTTNGRGDSTSTVHAENVPSKDVITRALRKVKENPEKEEELRRTNTKLYELIENAGKDPNGGNVLAMEVLTLHHKRALTAGNSHETHSCRELVSNTLVGGDVEKMIKQSFILAHPVTSQRLKNDAGLISKSANDDVMSESDTKHYYKIGNTEIVKQCCSDGIINQNQRESLLSWLQEDGNLDRDTPEYRECLDALKGVRVE